MSFIGFILWLALKIAVVYIAAKVMQGKGRSPVIGALFGFFLGWVGIIIAAVWPAQRVNVRTYEPPRQIEKPKADEWMHDWSEPEAVHEPIIEGEVVQEKSKRLCAYCDEEVPKTAMYCSSCGRLLDVY